MRSRIQASESTQLRVTRVFFFHYYLATSMTNWAQIFTGLLFYALCWDTPVRRLVFDNYHRCPVSLKTLDTIGNCQRLVFSLGVSQHMHKITNLWKFELNRSSKLRDNNERKKHPCHTKLCAFRCLISRPQILNLRSRNQIRGKLLLSQKLCHFRGSRFSQCFILSTSPHYSLPSKVLC